MKVFLSALAFVFCGMLFSSCKDEMTRTRTYRAQIPVFLTISDLRKQTVSLAKPRELAAPGKIYIFGNYLFINEVGQGIHIVDNSTPANPQFLNFINIPGNVDMAVNNGILYADSYVDLLAFDITNPVATRLVKRVQDVFESYYQNKQKGLIVGTKDTVITEVISEKTQSWWGWNKGGMEFFNSAGSSGDGGSYGTGGSTARFTLMNKNLYTVDHAKLTLFNVQEASNPQFVKTIALGGGIETIFPYDNKLFIGSTTGMHIYGALDASNPVKLATYQHITSCDPVVVQGKYAYVTLRSGTFCRLGVNVLDVLDIQDPTKPVKVSSFPMLNPHGLTISGNKLFICEGTNGLKAFNSSDVMTIGEKQLSFLKDIVAVDVIAGPKSLIVTGTKGVYQYDYSDASNLKLLSQVNLTIPVVN